MSVSVPVRQPVPNMNPRLLPFAVFLLSVHPLAAAEVIPPPAQLTQDAVQLSPFVISTERETGWNYAAVQGALEEKVPADVVAHVLGLTRRRVYQIRDKVAGYRQAV